MRVGCHDRLVVVLPMALKAQDVRVAVPRIAFHGDLVGVMAGNAGGAPFHEAFAFPDIQALICKAPVPLGPNP